MKTALIGIGHWGKVLQGELSKLAEIKYACDSTFDLNRVWNDPEVEAVFIATPTTTHFEIACQALEAGKHVFLEKPGTSSSADLEKLVNLAREKGLTLAVGYEFPHHPAFKKMKELIHDQEIVYVRLEYQKWGNFDTNIVNNLLCHDVSILKYLGLSPLSPRSERRGIMTDADILTTQFGERALSIISRVSRIKHRSVIVLLKEGGYLFSNDELFSLDKAAQELKKIEIDPATPVFAEIADFLSAIKDKRPPLIHGEFALDVYRIIEKA